MQDSKKAVVLSLFGDDESQLLESSVLEPVPETRPKRTERTVVRDQEVKRPSPKRPNSSASGSANQSGVLPGQGFLPGLSRRGRPRLAVPISPVERTAEHRRKRIEAGAKRVEIILDKEISAALDALADHYKEPRSDVISTLIGKAASKVLKK
jgi:hypothetical protein